MRNPLGCILAPVVGLAFYGAIAIATLTLVVYPFIYLQDASAANAYRDAPACSLAPQANDCVSRIEAQVLKVRVPLARPTSTSSSAARPSP